MEKVTIWVTKGLAVSFLPEVVSNVLYRMPASSCAGCGSHCDTSSKCLQRTLTLYRLPEGVLVCQSQTGDRTIAAEFIVTDNDGSSEFTALRAFKNRDEVRAWSSSLRSQVPQVQRSIEEGLEKVA
jgi:hypothetical protein